MVRLPAAVIAAIVSLWLGQITPATAGYDEGAAAFIRGDYELAWQEWLTLGERGHQSAQYNLGVLYSIGLGVEQNDEEASKWFRQAADRGLPAAQMRLGRAYLEGKGVPEDLQEAYFWFSLAATHFSLGDQHEQAVAARDSTGAELTRGQITEVLERAMSWRPLPQAIDESEKERLIAAPADEDSSSHQDDGSNALSSNGTSPEASPSQTAVVQSASGGEASGISNQDGQMPTSEAEIAAVSETPAPAAPSDADATDGQALAGEETSVPSSAKPADDGTDTLQTTAAGKTQAEAGDASAEDLPMALATAAETGDSEAAATADSPDLAARQSFAAHLSSVRSKDGTETEWQQLQNQFPSLLNDRTLTVRRIELAEQGTFYRVMAGPFADVDEAQNLCAQLKASDQYCAVQRLDEGPAQ